MRNPFEQILKEIEAAKGIEALQDRLASNPKNLDELKESILNRAIFTNYIMFVITRLNVKDSVLNRHNDALNYFLTLFSNPILKDITKEMIDKVLPIDPLESIDFNDFKSDKNKAVLNETIDIYTNNLRELVKKLLINTENTDKKRRK